jgi:NAD(P)-dependent dehydrogenase (short-subunit alcohol dehydrogenase family)
MAQRALITGCSSGIGRATAIELAKRGYDVVATARRPATIADLDVGLRLVLDVDDDASVAAARRAAGPIDVLVNNAGFAVEGATENVPLAEVRDMFETNFFGAARMIQAFVPAMRERGHGTVVNIASVAGVAAPPLGGYYAASKYALEALSESLHLEVAHYGIKVFVIEPGRIATEFGGNLIDHRDEPGPYAGLASMWQDAIGKLRGGADVPGPDVVAGVIATALESDSYQLRWPVGADAEMVSAARTSMTYERFEAAMRDVLGIDW